MFRRVVRAAVLDTRIYTSQSRTALTIPIRSRTLTTTTATVSKTSAHSEKSAAAAFRSQSSSPSATTETASTALSSITSSSTLSSPSTTSSPPSDITQVDPSIPALLPHLLAQPPYYATIHIHARPYLITAGDTLRLPFWMHDVSPGDTLRLNRVSIFGSRDYTLKGTPYINENLFECRATVLGVESEPLREKVKTKQRNRRSKTVKSKHKFTILKISELNLRGFEAEGASEQQ